MCNDCSNGVNIDTAKGLGCFEGMSVLEIAGARDDINEILSYGDNPETDLSGRDVAVLQDAYVSFLEDLAKCHTFITAANWVEVTRWHFGGDLANFVKTCPSV